MANQRKDYRELTVSETSGYNYSRVPGIRIQGKWLEELGFHPGDAVLVHCEDGKLTISRDEALMARKAAEQAFMAEEMKKLEDKFTKEKKRLHAQFVAEQEGRYGA